MLVVEADLILTTKVYTYICEGQFGADPNNVLKKNLMFIVDEEACMQQVDFQVLYLKWKEG